MVAIKEGEVVMTGELEIITAELSSGLRMLKKQLIKEGNNPLYVNEIIGHIFAMAVSPDEYFNDGGSEDDEK